MAAVTTYRAALNERLSAIQNGKFTDCEFLVGLEDGERKKFHAVKAMMMLESPFLEAVFNNTGFPLVSPIEIKNMTPKTFGLIIEYIHIGRLFSGPNDCENTVQLAVAADHLLIRSLEPLCIIFIKKYVNMSNVWPTLNTLLKYNLLRIADACNEVLQKNTIECLEHETFFTATSASLNKMLSFNVLNVTSEGQLANSCWIWAEQQSNDRRTAFRDVLPNLRLLNLSPTMMASIIIYLTDEECSAIFERRLKPNDSVKPLPATISGRTDQRDRPVQMEELAQSLIPSSLYSSHEIENRASSFRCDSVTNILCITPKRDLYLTGIAGLGEMHGPASIEYNNDEGVYKKVPRLNCYDCSVWVTIDEIPPVEYPLADVEYNSTWFVRFTEPTLLFKEKSYCVEVRFLCSENPMLLDISESEVNDVLKTKVNNEDFLELAIRSENRSWSKSSSTLAHSSSDDDDEYGYSSESDECDETNEPLFLTKFLYIVKE